MKNQSINRRNKIISSIAVTAFFVLTILVFAPGHLFLTNPMEFNANYFELLGYLLLIALPVFILISLVLVFLPDKYNIHQKVVVLLFILSFLLWLQGNYIIWNYGVLTGGKIEFNTLFLIFDGAIWIAAVIIAWIKSNFLFRFVKFFSIILIIGQVISTSIMVYNMPDISDLKRYEIDSSNKFTFSEDNNIIILLLDTFQSDVFQEIIDEDESYKDIFDGFIYYRDTLCGFPTTIASGPNILTGQYFDNSISYSEFLKKAYLSSNSVPAVLLANGFEVDCFGGSYIYKDEKVMSNLIEGGHVTSSTILDLYDAAFFRYLPDVLKNCVYRDGKWALRNLASDEQKSVNKELEIQFDEEALKLHDIAFIEDMLSRANTTEEKPIFKYYWLMGLHQPYVLNERLEYEEMDSSIEESYKRQAMGNLQVVKLFLDELKNLDIYDNSMLLIMGDHGIFDETLNIQSANPLLLIKKYDSRGAMEVSEAPVSLSDIPATIFSELGFEGEFSGENIFGLEESTNRTRTYYFYNWASPGFADWSKDYLPPIKEYLVSGPVYLASSWHMTEDVFTYGPDEDFTIKWQAGFSVPKEGSEGAWVWGSSNATMVLVNNTTEERRCILSGIFSTGYDEPANLSIRGDLINENIVTDRYGYDFRKEILITPGRHYIDFLCDAREFDLPDCPSSFVFKVEYFGISEYASDDAILTSDLLVRWTDGFSFLEENSGGNWRWCSSQGTLVLTNTSNQDREYKISATFSTGYPDPANLVIESTLFSDNLIVSNAGYSYVKEFILPPGRHLVHFTCDAKKVDAPGAPRVMVFYVGGFQVTEDE